MGSASLHVRVEPSLLAAIKAWSEGTGSAMTKTEAARRLIELGLQAAKDAKGTVKP